MDIPLRIERASSPMPAEERAAVLAEPGFGKIFTDHMLVMPWTADTGWGEAMIRAREPLPLDPACSVLHYAQEIFEGMKAYRARDGGVSLFRPYENARRFAVSAARMSMPAVDEDRFVAAVSRFVEVDEAWVPAPDAGSLYVRPFMIASEVFLGVRPAREYLFIVIASPAGPYFKSRSEGLTLWLSDYSRAAPGGTGAAKCGGNYAGSLLAQSEAIAQGCDQVLFLDAVERRWVEELGGMNVFFAFDDGSLVTPPLTGTILPGITRSSIMRLARDAGLSVREENYSIEQWEADAASGRLVEAFACGTAAMIASIGRIRGASVDFTIGARQPGPIAGRLRSSLEAIQRREQPDPYGWVYPLSRHGASIVAGNPGGVVTS